MRVPINLEDALEVIVLLALLPVIVGLWYGFSAYVSGAPDAVYYDGSYWVLIGQITTGTKFYEGNGTLMVTDSPSPDNATFIAIIYVDGDYANWNDTAPGTQWRAAIVLKNGTISEIQGTLGSTVDYDASYESNYPYVGTRLVVLAADGLNYHGYGGTIPETLYLWRQVTSGGVDNLLDALFIIMIFGVVATIASKLARG